MGFHNFFGQKIIFGGPVADPVKIRGPGFLLDFSWIPWIFTGFSLDSHWIFGGGETRGGNNSSCPNIFLEVREKTKKHTQSKEKLKKKRNQIKLKVSNRRIEQIYIYI